MKKNLTARTVVIIVTILLCIYGIIGLPTSKASLQQNLRDNIRLGLDLKGGSHLVLEVQVQDAVKADADTVVITIKGIPATQSSAFRSLVTEHYPTYLLTAVNSTDYTMKMKPSDL